jgi:hypothetical protein
LDLDRCSTLDAEEQASPNAGNGHGAGCRPTDEISVLRAREFLRDAVSNVLSMECPCSARDDENSVIPSEASDLFFLQPIIEHETTLKNSRAQNDRKSSTRTLTHSVAA